MLTCETCSPIIQRTKSTSKTRNIVSNNCLLAWRNCFTCYTLACITARTGSVQVEAFVWLSIFYLRSPLAWPARATHPATSAVIRSVESAKSRGAWGKSFLSKNRPVPIAARSLFIYPRASSRLDMLVYVFFIVQKLRFLRRCRRAAMLWPLFTLGME